MLYPEETVQSQYAASPTIRALVDGFNDGIEPRYDIKLFYDRIFNPATAQGIGLDIWARIVGVERNVYIDQIDKNFGFFIQSAPTETSYEIAANLQSLPGYGWSAGSAYNYVDFVNRKYVQQVDRVDLGALSWSKFTSAGHERFYTSGIRNLIKIPESNDDISNLLTVKYVSTSTNNLMDHVVDNCISVFRAVSTGYVGIYDSENISLTPTQFRATLNGVYLYYELATPIETDIATLIPAIAVEPNTALTFKNVNGDSYHTAVPSEISYTEDDETVTDNAVAYTKNIGDVQGNVTIRKIGGASFVSDGEIKSAAVTEVGYVMKDGLWQDWQPWDQGVFYEPGDKNKGQYRIDDKALRKFIFWKALANISTSDCYTLNRLLSRLFSSPVSVEETGVMHIKITTMAKLEDWQAAILAQYGMFGKPAGVGYEFWSVETPILGLVPDGDAYQPFGQAPFFNGVVENDLGGNE